MSTITEFKEFVSENKISIKGLDDMPELRMSKIMFDNPWDSEDDNLYVARGTKMTVSRTPDGNIHGLAKVSDDYKLVQHYEAVQKTLEGILGLKKELGIPEVSLGFGNNGGRMFAKILFKKKVEIAPKDFIVPGAIVTNSADLSRRYTSAYSGMRQVCTNGLMMPDSRFKDASQVKSLHKNGTLDIDEAVLKLTEGLKGFMLKMEGWRAYNDILISRDEFERVMDNSTLSVGQVKDVIQIPLRGFDSNLETSFAGDGKASAWKAYNAGTQWITDNAKNPATEIERGRALSESFESLVNSSVN